MNEVNEVIESSRDDSSNLSDSSDSKLLGIGASSVGPSDKVVPWIPYLTLRAYLIQRSSISAIKVNDNNPRLQHYCNPNTVSLYSVSKDAIRALP